ncbi:GNAT family N-acetyltransferase [Paenibacillus anaericanus]|uniref:GNAT family N-acetyltransferase n=1 Tax=Paenibacillus anaericanus TaxID=170367 RepID=A0A3S1DZ23_9BACL|nr:GNAT family N-acetyltransferase [Paenibacillus anaericanus]RUT48290.1 GNAT family N-acetyltransferase [Paenibacillus anaericanus]
METTVNWEEVRQLQSLCEKHDGITLKLNWDILNIRPKGDKQDLTIYRDGTLVAFLGRYSFGSKLEICGMVHPDHRRQGIFSDVMRSALDDWAINNHAEILLNAPSNSNAAKAFLSTISCQFSCSEYQMKYNPTGDTLPPHLAKVYLRPSVDSDRELLIQLDVEGFGETPEEAATQYSEVSLQDNYSRYDMIIKDEKPVGKIRVIRDKGESWIYGFVISSAVRGQGIGSDTLRQVIDRERNEGYDVWLEVALSNPNAQKLYESAGFQILQVQDYYVFTK